MNRLTYLFGTALLSLTLNAFAGDCPSLSGEYTIGKEGADFSSVSDAVNALKCGGVSGPVDFLIEDGVYNEKVVFSAIQGADAFNNVKFESKSGNNSEVVIAYGSSDATVALNGTQWVSFENLSIVHKDATYGSSLRADGKVAHLNFKGVIFDGVETTLSGENSATVYFASTAAKSDINFEDCEVNNGSIGIYKSGTSAETPDSKTSVIGTIFFNQYEAGLVLKNEDAPVISNNVVSSLSSNSAYKGINLETVSNNLILSNNIVNAANGICGVALNNCTAEATNLGQLVNNSIAVGGSKATTGLYLSGNTDNMVLNFNRIKLTINGAQNADQAYYKNSGSGNNINLTNNIFYDLKTGGYTIIGNTYKDFFNQLPAQSNPTLSVSANGLMVEKVTPIK